MGRTIQTQYTLYLAADVATKFEKLAADTRIAKAVLFREAVDDLLAKYKACMPSKARRSKP